MVVTVVLAVGPDRAGTARTEVARAGPVRPLQLGKATYVRFGFSRRAQPMLGMDVSGTGSFRSQASGGPTVGD